MAGLYETLRADAAFDVVGRIAVLEACAGNQTRAAKELGISRTTLVNTLRLDRITRPRD